MEKANRIKSLQTQRLQLDFLEKINYYKVPALSLFASIMAITNGFQEFGVTDFEGTLPKISLIFLVIGLVSFKLKSDRLQLKTVQNPVIGFRDRILRVAEKRKWVIEKNEDNLMIFKSIPPRHYNDLFYTNKQDGERIYIFIEHDKIYLKSIDNLDHHGFKMQKGNNLENEKQLTRVITNHLDHLL